MAKVDTILSRTTIISQSVQISYWPNKLMIQCIVGQKKMYNLSSLLKIRLSLWLFLSYLMNVLSLWLYLWKKVFIRKLIGLPCHPAGSPPFSFPHIVLFAPNLSRTNFFLALFWSFEPKVSIFRKVTDTWVLHESCIFFFSS